jgi:hypothetical protein
MCLGYLDGLRGDGFRRRWRGRVAGRQDKDKHDLPEGGVKVFHQDAPFEMDCSSVC